MAVITPDDEQFLLGPIFDNGRAFSLSKEHIEKYYAGFSFEEINNDVTAEPFSDNFDTQVRYAEKITGPVLKLYYNTSDLKQSIARCGSLYKNSTYEYLEALFANQMDKYRDYFFTTEREQWKETILRTIQQSTGTELVGNDIGHDFAVHPRNSPEMVFLLKPSGKTAVAGVEEKNSLFELYSRHGDHAIELYRELTNTNAALSQQSFQEQTNPQQTKTILNISAPGKTAPER